MANEATISPIEMPERWRPAQQAFERAVKKAFLSGEAHDPDGKGYAYWKAQDDADEAARHASPHEAK